LTGALASGTLRAAPGAPNKVRVSVNSQLTMAPFYQASESGYFTESGLSIELQKDMGSAQSIPLLAGSRLDVAFEGLNPGLYNAALRGGRVRIVAGRETISRSCRTMGVVYVSAKLFPKGVRSMRELQGKRVAISAGTVGSQFVLDVLLAHEGMRLEDVDVRKMSTEERLIAIRSGGIDAFVASAGDMTPMLRSLQIVPGPMLADIMPGFQYSYIAFGRDLLDGDADVGVRFLRAYLKGANDYLNGKTPSYVDEYAKSKNLDASQVREECRDSFVHDGAIRVQDIERFARWSSEHGYLQGPVDVSMLIDTRFLAALQRR